MQKLFARVLLANPEGYTADGNMFVKPEFLEWQQVEYRDPWDCDHQETMCGLCTDSWNCDYDIELPVGVEE